MNEQSNEMLQTQNETLQDESKGFIKQFGYSEWRGLTTLDENLFIWQFFLAGDELQGWQAHRIQTVQSPGWPPAQHSVWRRPDADRTGANLAEGSRAAAGQDEELVSLQVYESASLQAAHTFLLTLLGNVQSPEMARQVGSPTGDVAFAMPGGTSLLFARANLVVWLRNAGPKVLPLEELARLFDGELTRRPETKPGQVQPTIERFASAAREGPVGQAVPLEVAARDPLGRPLFYKFFSTGGEIYLQDGQLVYRPQRPGTQQITLFAVNSNRGAASQQLDFEAR